MKNPNLPVVGTAEDYEIAHINAEENADGNLDAVLEWASLSITREHVVDLERLV